MVNKPLWEKDLPLDQAIHRFTVGNDPLIDMQLVPYDLLGTAAHVRMLSNIGLLSRQDMELVIAELELLSQRHQQGDFTIMPEQEDCHTAIEQALSAALGAAGRNIHLGRSRNDQVILAMRMYLREMLLELGDATATLAGEFVEFARAHQTILLPGYTHLRRAMPSSFGIWTVAFAEALIEELEALQGVYQRLDRCPLGSGAGFGVPLQLDRELVAMSLGFSQVQRSVADVQNSRGRQELAVATWISGVGNVLEKYFWDIALYSTEEFGFIALPDSFTTGSSIMPQKRNPDVIELLRGRCACLRTLRMGIENILVGLPSNYHREYQLLKEPVFQSVAQGLEMLDITARVVPSISVNEAACASSCTGTLLATQAAYQRATSGELAFRDTYRDVGREVLAGKFQPPTQLAASEHLGGSGNLALDSAEEELARQSHWRQATRKHIMASCDQVLRKHG